MRHSFEYRQRGREGAEGSIIDFEKTIQAFLDFENKRLIDYFLQTLTLLNQMKYNGENVSNLQVVEKIRQILTM